MAPAPRSTKLAGRTSSATASPVISSSSRWPFWVSQADAAGAIRVPASGAVAGRDVDPGWDADLAEKPMAII
jgi:hypothetical protein